MIRRILSFLLLALLGTPARAAEPAAVPSNLDDVAAGYSSGMPLLRTWCPTWTELPTADDPTPAGLDYYAGLLKRGYRVVPIVTLPPYSTPKGGEDFQTARDAYSNKSFRCKDENRPFIRWLDLRYNNLAGTFIGNAYRFRPVARYDQVGNRLIPVLGPLTRENAPRSALVLTTNPDGTPEDEAIADTLGPVDNWRTEGELLGGSQFFAKLIAGFPALQGITITDNNEVANEALASYTDTTTAPGLPRKLLSDDRIRALSIRMADWVATRRTAAKPDLTLDDVIYEWHAARQGLFDAWRDGLASKLPEALRDVRTTQYQGMQEETWGTARQNGWDPRLGYGQGVFVDGAAQQFYLQGISLTDINCAQVSGRYGIAGMLGLIPGWESIERRDPRAIREVSVEIRETGITYGESQGLTKRLTPEIYRGMNHFVLWALSDPGHPLYPRWFSAAVRSSTDKTPTSPFDKRGDDTIETYMLQWAEAINFICQNPIYRDFYRRGIRVSIPNGHPLAGKNTGWQPYPDPSLPDTRGRFLECSTNPARSLWYSPENRGSVFLDKQQKVPVQIRTWVCAIKHPDAAWWLIVAFTPCQIDEPNITVSVPGHGDVMMPTPNPWSYTLVGTPPEPPPPKPLRTIKGKLRIGDSDPLDATLEVFEETVP